MNKVIRIRFAKGEEVKFLSHLDVLRTMERAIRRAKLPIALSEGFHPKPRITFAQALALGVTSEGEYMDIHLTESLSPSEVIKRLNQVFPVGFQALEASTVDAKSAKLMSVVERAVYQIVLDPPVGKIADSVETLLSTKEMQVEKETKKGKRIVDIRPLIFDLRVVKNNEEQQVLRLVSKASNTGSLRPEEVLKALAIPVSSARIHRLDLLLEEGRSILDSPQARS